ncbi:hypothetical protein [Gimesia sp.]|uniref:hypothetical protein n=1 Tax=Gimesia sp. TaxID=2024833 RepID=UPI003A8D3F79
MNAANQITLDNPWRLPPRSMIKVAACLLVALCLHSEAKADQRVFQQNLGRNPVKGCIEFYSSSTGNSGSYRVRNTTSQDLKYRVRIFMKNGKSTTRVIHASAFNYSRPSAFSYAGVNRIGIDRVDLLFARAE